MAKEAKQAKSQWIAAILNFFIWGLGYLYLGKRINFGIMLIIGEILSVAFMPRLDTFTAIKLFLSQLPAFILVSVAFAYDAYKAARE